MQSQRGMCNRCYAETKAAEERVARTERISQGVARLLLEYRKLDSEDRTMALIDLREQLAAGTGSKERRETARQFLARVESGDLNPLA
jgi:hypothetical protein